MQSFLYPNTSERLSFPSEITLTLIYGSEPTRPYYFPAPPLRHGSPNRYH